MLTSFLSAWAELFPKMMWSHGAAHLRKSEYREMKHRSHLPDQWEGHISEEMRGINNALYEHFVITFIRRLLKWNENDGKGMKFLNTKHNSIKWGHFWLVKNPSILGRITNKCKQNFVNQQINYEFQALTRVDQPALESPKCLYIMAETTKWSKNKNRPPL